MSPFRATALVAGRELRETFRRRSYWVILGVLVLGSSLAVILPDVLSKDGPTTYDVGLIGGNEVLEQHLRDAARSVDTRIHIEHPASVAVARAAVNDDDLDLVLVDRDQRPVILVERNEHDRLVDVVQQVLAADELANRLTDAGLSADQVHDVLTSPVAEVSELHAGRASRAGGAVILSIVLYILLLMLMISVANGVAIEKANRISEVLLAIVRPGPLMFGKVVGVGTAGLITTIATAVPVIVKGLAGGDLPPGLGTALVAGFAWFVLGIAFYLTISASLGALVERQEETGSAVAPLNAMILGAYLVAQSAPDTPVASVLAYVPFTSPLVVPVRLALGVTSPVEVVGSLVIGVIAVALAGRFGATVYRRAIVRTGRRLKLRDVFAQT